MANSVSPSRVVTRVADEQQRQAEAEPSRTTSIKGNLHSRRLYSVHSAREKCTAAAL